MIGFQSTHRKPSSSPARAGSGWAWSSAWVLALCLLSPGLRAVEDQGWFALSASGPMLKDSRLLMWFDGHARYRDGTEDLGVTIIRPGLGWRIGETAAAWAGYARVVARRDNAPSIEEDRAWEQLTYPIISILGGNLTGRTRLEQRYIDGADDTGHRLRQSLAWSRPIGGSNWSWAASNEIFINLNNTDFGADTGYGQNRTYFGLGWKPMSGIGFNFSYLYNHINNPFGNNQKNSNFAVGVAYRW